MKHINEQLIIDEANYIIETGSTYRATAKRFDRSKSAIHWDMRVQLPKFNRTLAQEVSKIVAVNLAERATRGGTALKHKRQKGGVQ